MFVMIIKILLNPKMYKLTNYEKYNIHIGKIGMNIHTEIQPLLKNIQPLIVEKYIDNSNKNEKNKKYYKNLFKKYIDFYDNKYIKNAIPINNKCPLDVNMNIYDPSIILQFINVLFCKKEH